MAMDNIKSFNDAVAKQLSIEENRAIAMINIATDDNASDKDRLLYEWINELKEKVIELECANTNLHRICGTSAFNPTES